MFPYDATNQFKIGDDFFRTFYAQDSRGCTSRNWYVNGQLVSESEFKAAIVNSFKLIGAWEPVVLAVCNQGSVIGTLNIHFTIRNAMFDVPNSRYFVLGNKKFSSLFTVQGERKTTFKCEIEESSTTYGLFFKAIAAELVHMGIFGLVVECIRNEMYLLENTQKCVQVK